jgi:hypothetical protein
MRTKTFILLLLLPLLHFSLEAQQLMHESVAVKSIDCCNTVTIPDKSQIVTPILLRESISNLRLERTFTETISESPFRSFASSLILPGSAQALQEKWWKAGLFAAIEATSIYFIIDLHNRARKGEDRYQNWANQNWSVVQYSKWLVNYHDFHQLENPYLEQLREMVQQVDPSFNHNTDWGIVDIELLRLVEKNTRYMTTDALDARFFSHVLPSYGSQQYYELISKYYQYQAGWKDYGSFHNSLGHTDALFGERFFIDRNGEYASPFFFDGAAMAQQFNDRYRLGGTFLSLLIANHVFSAFDAYFTLKLKQNRVDVTSNMLTGKWLTFTYRF